jgi:hypothetical protein
MLRAIIGDLEIGQTLKDIDRFTHTLREIVEILRLEDTNQFKPKEEFKAMKYFLDHYISNGGNSAH